MARRRRSSRIDAIASNRSIFGGAVRETQNELGDSLVDIGELLSGIGPTIERVVQGVGEMRPLLANVGERSPNDPSLVRSRPS